MWFSWLWAFMVGIFMPTQAGVNSILSHCLKNPLLAAFFSFLGGTLVLFLLSIIQGTFLISFHQLKSVPWYAWTGGLLGPFFVASSIYLIPKIGAANLISLAIAGQMVTSVFIDSYGIFGVPLQPFNLTRFFGLFLVILGSMIFCHR